MPIPILRGIVQPGGEKSAGHDGIYTSDTIRFSGFVELVNVLLKTY
jgi:hypothetical protein